MGLIDKLKEVLGKASSYKARCEELELKNKEQERQMEEAERLADQILEELE